MLSGGIYCLRFSRIPSDRFLTENMFACCDGCLDNLKVHTVWRGDVDELYVFVCDDISEIGSCAFKSET